MRYFTFILALLISAVGFGQAAGNYLYNQSLERDYKTTSETFDNQSFGYLPPYPSQSRLPFAPDTSITLTANILMNVKADSYMMILGVSQVAETVDSCHQMINRRIDTFIKNAAQFGVNKKDVFIDFISQVPVFEIEEEKKLFSKSYNEVPKGFELKKNIHLKYKDEGAVEGLLTLAAENEIYDIVKVDHVVENVHTVYDTLRLAAINLLNKKANDFKKLGITYVPMFHTVAEEIYGTYPLERYTSYKSFNEASIKNIKKYQGKSGSYTVRSRTIPASLYYNKLPYNVYDQVIHPVIVEPVVQFSYTLSMKYVLKKR